MKPIRLLLLVLCFCPLTVYAQTAEVGGAVQDPSGAVIPKASVEFRNQETGVRRQATTNGDGSYHIVGVDPGRYDATVQAKGFKTLTRENVVFQVGDKSQIDFKMQVGQESQTLNVDGSGININTNDATVSTVVNHQFVQNMPLSGRSFQGLIELAPGVVTQSPQTTSAGLNNGGDFVVNGQRANSNYYTVDGVSANTNPGSGAGVTGPSIGGGQGAGTVLGTTQSLVSVDALQEFRVTTSTYSAEYGRNPGGQFSMQTRSGTNIPHGSIFDYLRNDYFDANDWFNNHLRKPKTALRQNDFGGTFGAPVWLGNLYKGKDRTFFFVSYEGLRLTIPTPASVQYVPSLSLRASGAPSLQPILNSFPIPTASEIQSPCNATTILCPPGQPVGTPVASGLSPFVQGFSLPAKVDSTSLRLDQIISERVRVFLRAAYTPTSSGTRILSIAGLSKNNLQSYTAGVTAQLTQKIANEFRAGLTHGIASTAYTIDNFGGATPINLTQVYGLGEYKLPYEAFYLTIPSVSTIYQLAYDAENKQTQWNIVDSVSLQKGRHAVRVGIDYRRISSPIGNNDASALLFYTGRSGVESNTNSASVGKLLNPSPLYNQIGLYVQDEWRATTRLSISAGLRWELNPPPTSQNGIKPLRLVGSVDQPSSLALDNTGAHVYDMQYNALAPRLGFAYKAHGNPGAETVIRAGAGIFYDTGSSGTSIVFNGPTSTASVSYTNLTLPVPASALNFQPSANPPYSSTTYAISPSFHLPYTIQWNGAIEQGLGLHQTVTLSYVGANGRQLVGENPYSFNGRSPNFKGTLLYFGNGYTSNYQSLQIQFQRQVSRGLQALASYTWSHSLDYGSTDSALTLVRGNSDFDLRNNTAGALSWDLPSHFHNVLAKALTSAWGLDGRATLRSGFPVNLTGTSYYDTTTGLQRATQLNLISNVPIYLYGQTYPGGRAINNAAFQAAAANTQGNSPRNFVRGFGAGQIDLAARRDFPLVEGVHLQFRAEAFNLTNHPNFGYINPTLGNAQFGQATKSLSQSLTTVNALYQQGGPRSLQFALKLQF